MDQRRTKTTLFIPILQAPSSFLHRNKNRKRDLMILQEILTCHCGHDMGEREGKYRHTNTKDESRFFTLFCQECLKVGKKCSEPSPMIVEEKVEQKSEEKGFFCHYCKEKHSSKSSLMNHTLQAKHKFPEEKLAELLKKGLSKKEIVAEMGFPQGTIDMHIRKLLKNPIKDLEEISGNGNEDYIMLEENNKIPEIESSKEAKEYIKNLDFEGFLLSENTKLKEEIKELRTDLKLYKEKVQSFSGSSEEGILRSKIEISQYGGYYDSQRKLISESIKEEIYHAAKDRTITMESRLLPGDGRKILIKITGGGE